MYFLLTKYELKIKDLLVYQIEIIHYEKLNKSQIKFHFFFMSF